jgi:hypothetical protein
VTFSVTGSGSLAATTVQTTGGVASTTVTHPAVAGANNATVTVTASALGGSSSTTVKFINQPTSAVVSIALSPSVTGLTSLQFGVKNDPGASFAVNSGNEQAVGAAAGSLVAVGYDPATNVATPALINATGFTTGTSPIIQLTYAITSGLPTFSIDPSATISASTTTPISLSQSNFSVTWRYNTE